jgi:hypothetical protein
MAYYDIRQEGRKQAWDTTPGATPEDWDKALQIAQERASSQGRNYVIRHVGREGARLIVTATPDEGLAWPRYAVSALPVAELNREQKEPDPVEERWHREAGEFLESQWPEMSASGREAGVAQRYSPEVLAEIERRYPGETVPASVADAVEKLVNERGREPEPEPPPACEDLGCEPWGPHFCDREDREAEAAQPEPDDYDPESDPAVADYLDSLERAALDGPHFYDIEPGEMEA